MHSGQRLTYLEKSGSGKLRVSTIPVANGQFTRENLAWETGVGDVNKGRCFPLFRYRKRGVSATDTHCTGNMTGAGTNKDTDSSKERTGIGGAYFLRCSRYSKYTSHVRGTDRDAQHEYVVNALKYLGYRVVAEKHSVPIKNALFWEKILENVEGNWDFFEENFRCADDEL